MRVLLVLLISIASYGPHCFGDAFVINAAAGNANNRQSFDIANDVFLLDTNDFAINGALNFASDVGGDPGLLGTESDDENTFASDVNLIVLQNFDNNDVDGFPANWDNSFNARNALRSIANNTFGDRAGFYVYWNEKLGVNRLVYTENLNDGEADFQVLFAINSENLIANSDDLQLDPTFRAEANSNFNSLSTFSASNFSAVPEPASATIFALSACSALLFRRRKF